MQLLKRPVYSLWSLPLLESLMHAWGCCRRKWRMGAGAWICCSKKRLRLWSSREKCEQLRICSSDSGTAERNVSSREKCKQLTNLTNLHYIFCVCIAHCWTFCLHSTNWMASSPEQLCVNPVVASLEHCGFFSIWGRERGTITQGETRGWPTFRYLS